MWANDPEMARRWENETSGPLPKKARKKVKKAGRRFVLSRKNDVSGVSGTGNVAEGVQFDDGSVAMRWTSKTPSTVLYGKISDVRAVHGHDRKTKIKWIDVHHMRKELEKLGATYDPDIHNTKKKIKRLRRLEELQLRHRIRNTGVPIKKSGPVESLIGKTVGGGGLGIGSAQTSHKEKLIQMPGRPILSRLRPAAKADHRITAHHELDEARAMGLGRERKGIGRQGLTPTDRIRSLPQYQSHMDPAVIIQESNRVARTDPKSRRKLVALRSATGEKDHLRKAGVRYGEEVIPEGGRRFNKARIRMIEEDIAGKDIPAKAAKTVRSLRKLLRWR